MSKVIFGTKGFPVVIESWIRGIWSKELELEIAFFVDSGLI